MQYSCFGVWIEPIMTEMKYEIVYIQTTEKHLVEVDLQYQEGSTHCFDGY